MTRKRARGTCKRCRVEGALYKLREIKICIYRAKLRETMRARGRCKLFRRLGDGAAGRGRAESGAKYSSGANAQFTRCASNKEDWKNSNLTRKNA